MKPKDKEVPKNKAKNLPKKSLKKKKTYRMSDSGMVKM